MTEYFSDQLFRKQYPINRSRGLYHDGKTYIVYQGAASGIQEPNSDANDPRIMVYDHASELWSDDVLVGSNPTDLIDDHGNPAMSIDAEGRIHVIYGGHGTVNNSEMRHRVSVNPYDISEWEDGGTIPEEEATYPSLFTLDNGNMIYLYRGGQHEADWFYTISDDNGDSWSPPEAFLKGGGDQNLDSWYVYAHAEGNDLHVAFTYHEHDSSNHQPLRYHAYYIKRTAGGDWVDAAGNQFTEPITSEIANASSNQLRAHEFPETELTNGNTLFSTVDVDNTGKPFISSSMVEENETGKYVTNWTGTEWNVQLVDTHDGKSRFNTRTALLHRGGDDFSLFSFGDNGRDILEYTTTDGNNSWSSPETIWTGPADNPTVLWNPNDEAYLFFDDKGNGTSNFRKGYLYGDSGFVTNLEGGGSFTYEFENLSRSASDPTQVINLDGASNGKFVRLAANDSEDWIEFEVNADAGTYDLELIGRTAGARGTFQLSIDGINQGSAIDQYQSSTEFTTWDLGQATFNSSGTHILRFKSVGKSPNSGGFTGSFDSLRLTSSDSNENLPDEDETSNEIPITYEFETLNRTATDPIQIKNFSDASNGKFVRLVSNSIGDWIEFDIDADAGAYDLSLTSRTAGARGTFQLSIDGVDQGPEIDQYESNANFRDWDLGQAVFSESGSKTFRFEVIGNSANSGGFTGSFDSIELTPINWDANDNNSENEAQSAPNAIADTPQSSSAAASLTQTKPTIAIDSSINYLDSDTTATSIGLTTENEEPLELTASNLELGLYDGQSNHLWQSIDDGDVLLSKPLKDYNVKFAADISDPSLATGLSLSEEVLIDHSKIEAFESLETSIDQEKQRQGISSIQSDISLDIYPPNNLNRELLGDVPRNFTFE